MARQDPATWRDAEGAFTVIELLLVIAVIGILVAIAVPLFRGYVDRVKVAQAVTDIRTISAAVESYRSEFARVPGDYVKLVDPVPVDPWGNAYQYMRLDPMPKGGMGSVRKDKNLVPLNSDFDLFSTGKDGKSKPPLAPKESHDDVIRANDGGYVGLASGY